MLLEEKQKKNKKVLIIGIIVCICVNLFVLAIAILTNLKLQETAQSDFHFTYTVGVSIAWKSVVDGFFNHMILTFACIAGYVIRGMVLDSFGLKIAEMDDDEIDQYMIIFQNQKKRNADKRVNIITETAEEKSIKQKKPS